MLIGIDTNILIYAIDSRAGPKHEKAVQLIEQILKNPRYHVISF